MGDVHTDHEMTVSKRNQDGSNAQKRKNQKTGKNRNGRSQRLPAAQRTALRRHRLSLLKSKAEENRKGSRDPKKGQQKWRT